MDKNLRQYKEMIRKSRQNRVPVSDFNGKIILGFDPKLLDIQVAKLKRDN